MRHSTSGSLIRAIFATVQGRRLREPQGRTQCCEPMDQDPPPSLVTAHQTPLTPETPRVRYVRLWRVRAVWWIGILVGLILMLWLLGPVITPFAAGALVAYFLNPLANKMQRLGMPRVVAATLLVVIMLTVVAAVVILVVPVLVTEADSLISTLPDQYDNARRALVRIMPGDNISESAGAASDVVEGVQETLADAGVTVLGGVITSLNSIVRTVVFWVLMPVVAFFLLMDWQRLVAGAEALVPRTNLGVVRRLAGEVDTAISGYLRGVIIVCTILAIYYAGLLEVAGLNYGFLVGFIAGLVSFIPYIGAFVGGALAIGIALGQFWEEPFSIALVVGIFVVGQFLESQILVPRIVGSSINLHPVWLLFAVLAFGYLFGLAGAIAAVPLAAALAVLVRYAMHEYQESEIYDGTTGFGR